MDLGDSSTSKNGVERPTRSQSVRPFSLGLPSLWYRLKSEFQLIIGFPEGMMNFTPNGQPEKPL